MADCQVFWIIFQGSIVFAAILLGSGLIGNLIITIRCVLPQDKALALSFELWLGGLIVYLPGKFLYSWIADSTCQYWNIAKDQCFIHQTPDFGDWMLIATAILIGISIFFDVLVFILVYDMPMYGDEEEEQGGYR
jgi:Organic Anion Transporter Polypeptide (OATP) family